MVERVVVRSGSYRDPVTLMEASTAARTLDGVRHVAVGMVERLNVDIIAGRHGYQLPGEDALGPSDVVIALRAESDAAATDALATIDRYLLARHRAREVVDVGALVLRGDRPGRTVPRVRWSAEERAGERTARQAMPRVSRELAAGANDAAVARLQAARPLLAGVGRAGHVLPDMTPRTFLHAGPPIAWSEMSGPMRGAIIAAALFEELAVDAEDAARRAAAGEFEFAPGHEHAALGPMAGVISHSMPVWIVENDAHGNRAHCALGDGSGGQFIFGSHAAGVVEGLRWVRAVMAPVLRAALPRLPEPLDLRRVIADALEMGDEVHNRNRAATALAFRPLALALLATEAAARDRLAVARHIADDDFFFLNLAMAAGKASADAASGIEHCTIVTAMARNGTEFGLRVSGTGDRWFTAPSSIVHGCYLPGYGAEDANPDMGDSTITETVGLGGLAWAGAPAIAPFAGVTAEDTLRATLAMYQITWSESDVFRLPALGYRGTPLGIDCQKVLDTGITPVADTGIAHREAGVGEIGGGYVKLPMGPFAAAVRAIAQEAPAGR